jgi:hypothetical protein
VIQFGEQLVVVQFGHLPNNVHQRLNWTNYYGLFFQLNQQSALFLQGREIIVG